MWSAKGIVVIKPEKESSCAWKLRAGDERKHHGRHVEKSPQGICSIYSNPILSKSILMATLPWAHLRELVFPLITFASSPLSRLTCSWRALFVSFRLLTSQLCLSSFSLGRSMSYKSVNVFSLEGHVLSSQLHPLNKLALSESNAFLDWTCVHRAGTSLDRLNGVMSTQTRPVTFSSQCLSSCRCPPSALHKHCQSSHVCFVIISVLTDLSFPVTSPIFNVCPSQSIN